MHLMQPANRVAEQDPAQRIVVCSAHGVLRRQAAEATQATKKHTSKNLVACRKGPGMLNVPCNTSGLDSGTAVHGCCVRCVHYTAFKQEAASLALNSPPQVPHPVLDEAWRAWR